MEGFPPTAQENRSYFVMNKANDAWIRVSKEFKQRHEAEVAWQELRLAYPFARIGGNKGR
ncbi:MAG: hypothetical protein GY807_03560 [Gammaproteobacteria bacterium]|nr:hypothetical protein [Gammaproteobacteria bacterium]